MEQNCDAVPPYPESIIPSYSFKDVIEEKDLTAIEHRLVIQRRASASDLDIVTPESFGTNLAEMSVNLMGGTFQPGFISWNPKGACKWPCDSKFSGEYTYTEGVRGLYISVPDIHNKTFPSSRKFNNREQFDKNKTAILKSFQQFSSSTIYEVSYLISVQHRPTNANYWHCQIEIAPATFAEEKDTIRKDKASWQKDALRALTNFLTPYASFLIPAPIPEVSKEWYVKKTENENQTC